MESSEFHEKKIEEILKAYKSSDSPFVQGVCLFYIAVHTIDWVLTRYDVSPSTHRGRKNLITRYLEETVFSKFDQLLIASIRIRYTEYAREEVNQEMKENLKELLKQLKENYSLDSNIVNGILEVLEN